MLLFLQYALNLHGHSFSNAHRAYKGYYHSFQVTIKPTKPTTSTLRNHQEVTSQLTRWSLSRAVLQLKKLFFKPQSFGFPLQVPTRVGRFFINWSFLAIYPRQVLQGLSFNATFLQEVGFPRQSPIGLGGFSLTRLPFFHALRVEFSKLPNCLHCTWVRSCLGLCS